jgi:hypothetical protein
LGILSLVSGIPSLVSGILSLVLGIPSLVYNSSYLIIDRGLPGYVLHILISSVYHPAAFFNEPTR